MVLGLRKEISLSASVENFKNFTGFGVSLSREHIMNKANLSESDFRVEADILVWSSKTSGLVLTETLQQSEFQSHRHSQESGEIVCQGDIGLVFILPSLWDYVGLGTRS